MADNSTEDAAPKSKPGRPKTGVNPDVREEDQDSDWVGIPIRAPRDLRDAWRNHCKRIGDPMSFRLRMLIREDIANNPASFRKAKDTPEEK